MTETANEKLIAIEKIARYHAKEIHGCINFKHCDIYSDKLVDCDSPLYGTCLSHEVMRIIKREKADDFTTLELREKLSKGEDNNDLQN